MKENSSRRNTMQRHQTALLDANHCWQWGGLTPPTQAPGRVPPRRLPVIEMEISGSNASEKGNVSLSLPVSLSVHPAVLYYCHFLFALTHNHSWHIITFSMFISENLHAKLQSLKSCREFSRDIVKCPIRRHLSNSEKTKKKKTWIDVMTAHINWTNEFNLNTV